MKTTARVLLLAMLVIASSCADEPIYIAGGDARVPDPNPGMARDEFGAAWAEIGQQLPADEAILSISAKGSAQIEVTTCDKGSHSRGTGHTFIFEKQAGKWKQTGRGSWLS